MFAKDIPQFGPLQGVRVVHLTQSVAGPYGPNKMAEFGADVIWVENIKGMDVIRGVKATAEHERRNQRSIAMDVPSEEGKKVFADLLKTADVLVTSYKGGQMAKWGLTDDVLLEINPRLIISHITGFGEYGDPDYYTQASFDGIAQAFSGYMVMQGWPDRPPVPALTYTADYVTALMSTVGILMALYRREKTGKGEVIDCAQFESMLSIQGTAIGSFFDSGKLPVREGSRNAQICGFGLYSCKDGVDLYCCLTGVGVLKNAVRVMGLEDTGITIGAPIYFNGTPDGDIFGAALEKYCAEHTSAEVEAVFGKNGLPCSQVMTYDRMEAHPHYIAREVFTSWENTLGETRKGVAPVPKFKFEPAQIWRGLTNIGEDTNDILAELGYSEERIKELADLNVAKVTTKR